MKMSDGGKVMKPRPWLIMTVLPEKNSRRCRLFLLPPAATTGLPTSAAISMPVCGPRGSPLKKRNTPNVPDRDPWQGGTRRNDAGAESE